MTDVPGFDTAATLTDATLAKFASEGGKYIELYEKYATPALVQRIFAHGLSIGLIWETTAARALSGFAAGKQDAEAFLARAPTAFGAMPPPSVAPALTVDFDCTEAQLFAVLDYINGWDQGMGHKLRTRVYGNGLVCQRAKAAFLTDFTWVAGGSGMTGTKLFLASGKADEVQDVGDKQHLGLAIDIDSDTAIDPALPWAWHPPGMVSVPPMLDAPVVPPAATRDLRRGNTGDDVRALQSILPGIPVDGIFGPQTEGAVKQFQLRHRLQADGVVGPLTRKALGWKNP